MEIQERKIWGYEIQDDDFSGKILQKDLLTFKWLSIQVHPVKYETWYIKSGGSFVYLGLNKECSRQEIIDAIENKTIESLLNKFPAEPGDMFHVPQGTIHAVGPNLLVYEVQINHDVTYRLYDFERSEDGVKRELHLEEALECCSYKKSTKDEFYVGNIYKQSDNKLELLFATQDYYVKVERLDIQSVPKFSYGYSL